MWLLHAYVARLHPCAALSLPISFRPLRGESLLVLQKADRKVAERVGVNQAHLLKLVQSGQRRNMSEADMEKERICKRFFMALMLNDIIQEVCGRHHEPT